MSPVRTGSSGSSGLTAGTSGSPWTVSEEVAADKTTQEWSAPALKEGGKETGSDARRTRATSVTEVADSQVARHDQEAPSSTATPTISEVDAAEDAVEQAHRHSMVQALARRMTNESAHTAAQGADIFRTSAEENSPLNPNGPNFRARAWAKAVVDLPVKAGKIFGVRQRAA